MQFFDNTGLLHDKPQPYKCTNSALFTAEYYMFKHLLGETNREDCFKSLMSLKHDGQWHEYTDYKSTHHSHDNKTGIEVVSYMLNLNLNEGNSFKHLHPRDLIFYGLCTKNPIYKLFSPLLMIIHVISCLKTYKIRYENGQKKVFYHTDGKILAFMRMRALYNDDFWMRVSWKVCTKIIKRSKIFNSWSDVFNHYFDNNHPISILARRLKWWQKQKNKD